jgi:peptide deformylase
MPTESEIKRDSIAPVDCLEVVLYPDPRLDKLCRAISPEELTAGVADQWNLKELSRRMFATMYYNEGVGLAAPQVGVPLRLFTIDVSGNRNSPVTIINPVLSDMTGTATEEEGCLSIPDVRVKVKRALSMTLSGVDVNGQPLVFQAKDLFARCCQHETDHLNGVLILKYLSMVGRVRVRRQLAELEEDFQLSKKHRK